jgi:hypothetical protein
MSDVSPLHRFKPGVKRHFLLAMAGGMWLGVGILLLTFSYTWLHPLPPGLTALFGGVGIAAALAISRFGFLKIVDKNVKRILPMEGKRCAFAFMSWKSYLLVAVMVTLGITIRRSSFPKPYLSILYTGIGLALILSSVRYWRVFFSLARRDA